MSYNVVDLSTGDDLQYTFYPVSSGIVNFKVRAPNDAHIALTTGPGDHPPLYEIMIGGWGNTKSVIRKDKQKPEKVEVNTPGIMNGDEFRGFWVRWGNGSISAGQEGNPNPFISWDDPEPFHISFFGVCTGWGASGNWRIEVPTHHAPSAPLIQAPMGGGGGGGGGGQGCWVDARQGVVPPGACVGGQDGEQLFVGRAQHEGALLPGKIVQSHGVCYVAWGGAEHGKDQYQVLCNANPNWVRTNGANIPPGALPGGETEDGEPLFVGRVPHEGTLTVGKVQPSHGVCYISYGGQELGFQDYEILLA